jgi:hypothetical protein
MSILPKLIPPACAAAAMIPQMQAGRQMLCRNQQRGQTCGMGSRISAEAHEIVWITMQGAWGHLGCAIQNKINFAG